MPQVIQIGVLKNIPDYADPLIRAIGLTYLKFGRIEQHLDFLLQSINDARYVTGKIPRYPDTSFRLKVKLFKKIFAKHPRFQHTHQLAAAVIIGLKKANQSRNRIVHSNIQEFSIGPPVTIRFMIVKFIGRDLKSWNGHFTLEAIENYSTLLDRISEDLGKITQDTINVDFLLSLEKELSRTERVTLWVRDRLSRLPRLRIDRPWSQF